MLKRFSPPPITVLHIQNTELRKTPCCAHYPMHLQPVTITCKMANPTLKLKPDNVWSTKRLIYMFKIVCSMQRLNTRE